MDVGTETTDTTETREMTPHRLPRIGTLACACVLVLAGLAPALAQFLPAPGQSGAPGQFPAPGQSGAFPPPPGQSAPSSPPVAGGVQSGPPGGFSPPGGSPPGAPPPGAQSVCMTFPSIRQAAEEGAAALRAAGQRKAPREEVCELFKSFAVKEARLVKFLVDNKTACGVPPEAITGVKANHAKTLDYRKNVCSGGGPAPGPSLSDALGGPIIADDTSAKQPGRGTFDTLTGNALSR
jgi:hypothetical protein